MNVKRYSDSIIIMHWVTLCLLAAEYSIGWLLEDAKGLMIANAQDARSWL